MNKICKGCGKIFESSRSNKLFCNSKCRQNFFSKKDNIKRNKNKEKIICLWCGEEVIRIHRHILNNHKDKTFDDYKNEFPNAPINTSEDKINLGKESGKHMKEEKYRKMFSENFKGEKNPNHRSKTTEQERKERSPFSIEFYKKNGLTDKEALKKLNNFKLGILTKEG